jgi:hypothetical protein
MYYSPSLSCTPSFPCFALLFVTVLRVFYFQGNVLNVFLSQKLSIFVTICRSINCQNGRKSVLGHTQTDRMSGKGWENRTECQVHISTHWHFVTLPLVSAGRGYEQLQLYVASMDITVLPDSRSCAVWHLFLAPHSHRHWRLTLCQSNIVTQDLEPPIEQGFRSYCVQTLVGRQGESLLNTPSTHYWLS